jgi:hypothetical protein
VETIEMAPELAPLSFLIGIWRGSGAGEFPTVDDFAYEEELHFWHAGKPHLLYTQKTWITPTGRPSHSEMGFWRPAPGSRPLSQHLRGELRRVDG